MTVILIRHGRSTANTSGLLAGRTPGVGLDDRGRLQADDLPNRLAGVLSELTAVVRSPLQRCAETVDPLVALRPDVPHLTETALEEVDYGEWSNRKIGELVTEPLWKVVQQQPSAAVFPGGEGLLNVSRRATAAIRELDRVHGGESGDGIWVACSHGDVIKAVLADALGMHLDQFQRIVVDPASFSVIHYGSARPYVHTVNNAGVLEMPRPAMKAGATVGGSTGEVNAPAAG
ncbi:MSMEG_4193 family putative phosphomutase [Gordonia sp. (in: high G+C Gram-positive bacteria)]|uniref:MSMEG_4193 family putative phosphomutase n=1 Tax=Gordonia sp. (in: high G+C Gram-positive bacteria) TaxID=84139 RepID=UPI00169019A0|nr:MSMEG_4193 family putative phosphomutase [Gordonia sp. (in: high G+C Gram-positive bacteria)]NLG47050.1 MSMEG_4193 family putative phosphomutase [Gordonia sp. (in: high G+C Gram-positive bacteria)]